ncbi:MAG: hypothetical protein HEQ35_10515 [Gloeotrichia echinulata IR180]|jgi:hypothetical protein|nr:hypothetical protein [Gloeotrichia echinulata DEX184]
MLKPLLLSGWFRVQPFLKYVVLVILIAPLVATSAHSTSANQSQISNNTDNTRESDSESKKIAAVRELDLAEAVKAAQINSLTAKVDSVPPVTAVVGEKQGLSSVQKMESVGGEVHFFTAHSLSKSNLPFTDPLAAVELAPSTDQPLSQLILVQKLKAARVQSLRDANNYLPNQGADVESLAATQITPNLIQSQPNPNPEVPVSEQPLTEQAEQTDPIGSPHPIPWKWITATQEAIGSQGGSGVRYYRSAPVVSPDGKYVVYSRVKLEVRPELYNSRVTSVLFIEDRQNKILRVMATTSTASDPLLKTQLSSPEQSQNSGTIGVLVPVSWSEKGDRFLARKFQAIFNTADATDYAVIWDRQKNNTNTVTPLQQEDEHEKIAILLGWSKSQPDHVLFRAGELGDENWPLVKVASDGKTVTTTTDADQPITFGDKVTELWADPQVASR